MTTKEIALVAPHSVGGWYAGFAAPDDVVEFIGEHDDDVHQLAHDLASRLPGSRFARIHSGHDSFERDRLLAAALEALGWTVRVQSSSAVACALDKVTARRRLESAGVPVTPWGEYRPDVGTGADVLVKRRDSTQSSGLEWFDRRRRWDRTLYWERWVSGVEYSIVGYRDVDGTSTLPAVWKGETRRTLQPPWMRLRVCPPPRSPFAEQLEIELAMLAIRSVEAIDVWGFWEVEFIVPEDGLPLVIEINPRISGTTRIAAMTARVPIFDRAVFPGGRSRWPARGCSAEVPYEGPAIAPTESVIATSRLSCSGPDEPSVRALIEHHGAFDLVESLDWPAGWA